MSLNFLLFYSMTVFIASIIPGPSMLLALSHGMQYGARKSVASAMGNVSITIVQALISIAGLGTVLMTSESIFLLIKWTGAAYLIYMGISILRSPGFIGSESRENVFSKSCSKRKMYLQAAIVTAGNPKAILFFAAVFPQFIDPESAYLLQSVILLGLGALIAFVCFMTYALCGQKILHWLSNARMAKAVKNLIGTGFIGAGIGLAASNR